MYSIGVTYLCNQPATEFQIPSLFYPPTSLYVFYYSNGHATYHGRGSFVSYPDQEHHSSTNWCSCSAAKQSTIIPGCSAEPVINHLKNRLMAIQMGTFLRGKMGNVIFVKRGDSWYARTAPTRVKQAPTTKGFSSKFGRAANIAKILRQQLVTIMPYPRDKKMQNRWGGAISKWLYRVGPGPFSPIDSLPFISGFVFNEALGNTRSWIAALTVTQSSDHALQLQVPAFVPALSFKAPAGTVLVACRVTVAHCNLQQPVAPPEVVTRLLQIPFNAEPVAAQTIPFLLPPVAGSLLVTAIGIWYSDAGGNRIAKKTYLPALVIDARYC